MVREVIIQISIVIYHICPKTNELLKPYTVVLFIELRLYVTYIELSEQLHTFVQTLASNNLEIMSNKSVRGLQV